MLCNSVGCLAASYGSILAKDRMRTSRDIPVLPSRSWPSWMTYPMTLEGRWPRVACPPTTPAFRKLLREHSPAWTTVPQVILHFGFCYRIKTPRWLEWPWNLSTDYSGFTWSESNVKATLRLRGTGRCALRRVCSWRRPWNRTARSLHGLFAFLVAYPIPVKTCSELMVPARPQASELHRCLLGLCQSISLRQDS